MNIKCGHCRGRHETVSDVRACVLVMEDVESAEREEKAAEAAREAEEEREAYRGKMARDPFTRHPRQDRAGEPEWMRTDAQPAVYSYAKVTQDGMYRIIIEDPHNEGTTGQIWKVQWNRASGNGRRLYAKVLTDEPSGEWHFEYVAGGILKLRPENRMTLEEAQQFGKLYGVCCVCGRTLTDEVSIEAGIGPVCAGRL